MPHKFNAARRIKFLAAQYRVANRPEYNEALRRRGNLCIWFDEEAVRKWSARRPIGRGGQARYSDYAIEICLALRLVFHQLPRQVQDMVRSLMRLLGLALPDFSTLSRRGKGLHVQQPSPESKGPITLIVDSTGLSIHRGSGWNEIKHGTGKTRKSWRKLHVGLDPDCGEIVAPRLTTEPIGDEAALPELIADLDKSVVRFLADGAYDGTGVFTCLQDKFGPEAEVIISPPSSAVPGLNDQRDAHIESIARDDRMKWQVDTGYNLRAVVEAQIERWKTIIGGGLKSRSIDTQNTEVRTAMKTLNRMSSLGRAAFERA